METSDIIRYEFSRLTRALQWSHRPSAMETPVNEATDRSVVIPSMEPPPFGDGNEDPDGEAQRAGLPSMEPPPFGDGNMTYIFLLTVLIILQWSHRPSAMETAPAPAGAPASPAFNGATALRRWKLRPKVKTSPLTPPFNGATALRRWKLAHFERRGRRVLAPSMELPPFGDGNPMSPP